MKRGVLKLVTSGPSAAVLSAASEGLDEDVSDACELATEVLKATDWEKEKET